MPRRLTPEEVQGILNCGAFNDFLGVFEDEHLEFKDKPYDVQHNYQKLELAKDVSALANLSARNSTDGGHILLPLATGESAAEHGDVVRAVNPCDQRLVDPRRYYDILEEWLVPVPAGMIVRWYPSAADGTKGIVAITIPRQRQEDWPFLVDRAVDEPLLECWPDGSLIFAASASDFICLGSRSKTNPLRINPLALAEITYLFADLAHQVYEQHAAPVPNEVEFSLALYRMHHEASKAALTPWGRKTWAFQWGDDARVAPHPDAHWKARVSRPWSAGTAAYELLSEVYRWFGFDEDVMPYVVEQDGKRRISAEKIIEDGKP